MWVLAVSIGVPIFSVILLAMLSYIVWQRYKLVRMIDSDEWNIPIEDIVFFEDKQFSGGKSGLQGMVSMKSFVSLAEIPDGPGVSFFFLFLFFVSFFSQFKIIYLCARKNPYALRIPSLKRFPTFAFDTIHMFV